LHLEENVGLQFKQHSSSLLTLNSANVTITYSSAHGTTAIPTFTYTPGVVSSTSSSQKTKSEIKAPSTPVTTKSTFINPNNEIVKPKSSKNKTLLFPSNPITENKNTHTLHPSDSNFSYTPNISTQTDPFTYYSSSSSSSNPITYSSAASSKTSSELSKNTNKKK
jgi:hypothetical protein